MEEPLKGHHVFRELQTAYHAWAGECKLSVDIDMSTEVVRNQIMRMLCFMLRSKDSSPGTLEPLEGFKTRIQYNQIYNGDK